MTAPATLVIDIGGTSAKFAASRAGRHLPQTRTVATAELRAGGDPLVNLAGHIARIGADLLGRVDVVVASVPGLLDPDRDLVRFAGNIPELNGRRVATELSRLTGLPVLLERDAILSLRGEWLAGAGRGAANLLGLFFGTGVGGALLTDGQPFRGAGFALEIGNMPFRPEGRHLPGMRTDCLEAYVSGRVLQDIAARHGVPIEQVFASSAPGLVAQLDRFLTDQAIAIGIAFSLFSPDRVVIGGGIPAMAGFPFDRLCTLVARHSTTGEMGVALDIRPAELGWGAALHGAGLVALEHDAAGGSRPAATG